MIRSTSITKPSEEGTNGKHIGSSRAFEEGTEESTTGSPTVYGRTLGSGPAEREWPPHIVGLGAQEDKPRAEETMGESERARPEIGAETATHDLSCGSTENRSGTKSTLGQNQGASEDGVRHGAKGTSPASANGFRWTAITPAWTRDDFGNIYGHAQQLSHTACLLHRTRSAMTRKRTEILPPGS